MTEQDPFAALGLPPRADLSDDDVRAAWRRIAAATHPDRGDGGDPARFSAAAAAYALLRTAYGRGEALADLGSGAGRGAGRGGGSGAGRGGGGHGAPRGGRALLRVRRAAGRHHGAGGRIRVLALRIAAAAAVCGGAFGVAGWAPASIGVLAGVVTWLTVTGRRDIARAGQDHLAHFRAGHTTIFRTSKWSEGVRSGRQWPV